MWRKDKIDGWLRVDDVGGDNEVLGKKIPEFCYQKYRFFESTWENTENKNWLDPWKVL